MSIAGSDYSKEDVCIRRVQASKLFSHHKTLAFSFIILVKYHEYNQKGLTECIQK